MTDLVLPLDSAQATLAAVGGKGANLSELVRAGFPVPPGFLVTTAAYWAFVHANDLQQQIVELAKDGAETGFDTVSATIRSLFESATMPPEVAGAIQQALAGACPAGQAPVPLAVRCSECHCGGLLGEDGPLAVRSSATAEDLPGASFAGQQETFLNVSGELDVLPAVKRCWSSLWTPRALAYRQRQGIDPATVSLAVVVQRMVPASAAGVLFTANPLTGARDEIVIDAAWGLGEAVVSGLVTPDHITAGKTTGTIKHLSIADKTVQTTPTPGGTDEFAVPGDKRVARVLNADQVAQLARLGAAIEAHYQAPQDIEWCLADNQFWIVQSRPITTLPPESVRWDSPVPGAKWMNDLQAAEWATEPLSPLGVTVFDTMITARQREYPLQKRPWYALVNGWLYIRVDCHLLMMVTGPAWWLTRAATGTLDGHRYTRRTWPAQLTLLDSLERTELAKLSDADLQAHVDRLLGMLGWWWWRVSFYPAVVIMCEKIIGKLHVPDLADAVVLFRGNDSLLLEAERALRHAADTGEVEPYLTRFGHQVESADPVHPTLRESPDLLTQYLAMARNSMTGPDERLAHTRQERARAESHVRGLRGLRGFAARQLVESGQSFAAHTDDAVFHFQRVLALLRVAFLQAGQRLARLGAVEQADDVFYLQAGEVWARSAADLSERITQRRQLRERHKRLVPPPFIPPLSDPAWGKDRVFKIMKALMGPATIRRGAQDREGRRVVVGMSGSPGRARGVARLITGPDDFHRFQPGDVLIAHATTPVWTPLFNIASAAVTEVGGNFSHAAIVAREFGIPLVNGALDATRAITDGTLVMVDGSAGIVELSTTAGAWELSNDS